MRFSHDRRGQSVVVGVVILFGFLIVAMAVYQAQVVPQENANVEFEHSQEVENDIGDLRNAILRAGSTGSAQPARVRLGTRYPQRTFFVNPAPVTGEIRTTEQQPLRIENVDIGDGAHENVGYFWGNYTEFDDGTSVFDTRSLQYTPNYNEYRNGPTLTYEHSFVAAEFPNDATLLRTNQTIRRSDRISLTVLSGDVSENGVEARSVDPEAVSQGTRTVPIVANTDSEIVLPTAVGDEVELANRTTERYPNIDATTDPGSGEIRLQLEEGEEFRLRLSEVSVDGEGETEPAYIVPVGSETVAPGGSVGVEVRDKYNNPVAGADVTIDGDDFITDDDGRVFTGTDSADTITATINDGVDDYESVQFIVLESGDGEGLGSRVGEGGEETWSEEDPTRTIATRGGLWTEIGEINSIVLSDVRLSPVSPEGTTDSDERYFGLALTVGDDFSEGDGRRYVFVLPDEDSYDINDLDPDQEVRVYEETKSNGEITSTAMGDVDGEALDPATFRSLVENGDELDILEPESWESPSDVEGDLETIRTFLESDDGQEAFIAYVNGRVDLTFELRERDEGTTPPDIQGGLRYEGGLTTTASGSAIQFNVRNIEDDFARINAVRVDSRISNAPEFYNGNGERVVEITGGNPNGFLRTQGVGNPQSRALDADGSSQSLDQTAVLEDEAEGTVFVGQFGEAAANDFNEHEFGSLTRVTEQDDWDVEVVLEFQDRSEDASFYFSED